MSGNQEGKDGSTHRQGPSGTKKDKTHRTLAAISPQQNDSVNKDFTPRGSTSTEKYSTVKACSRLSENSTKAPPPIQVIKAIPMSGSMEYPPFYLAVGSLWNILFINLTIWLPELSQMNLAHQNSVVIQYKTDSGWTPLAGDQQLNAVLSEFLLSNSDLRLRCTPESEFRSGPDSEPDDHESRNQNHSNDNAVEIAVRDDRKIVG